ncbi:MAG TPA: hypothetical protein VGL10_03340 [Gammaproteobacteria bacterium]
MSNFWLNELIKGIVFYSVAWLLGLWVLKRGIRVNYTRKIFHFMLFFFPLALMDVLPYQSSFVTIVLSGLIFLCSIGTFIHPLRSRSSFLATAYASFDRPEDRPFTLLWLSTQVLATYAVMIPVLLWLGHYGKESLIYITLVIAGMGDGLAEPVGVRFGKHKYRTRAFFTDRVYTRSIEGSLCVLFTGIFAVILLRGQLTAPQFWLALAIIPLAMTLAEALSPHTWDSPFLYLVGGTSTVAVLEISASI